MVCDLAYRLLEGVTKDVDADRLVIAGRLETVERPCRIEQRNAAAGDDAILASAAHSRIKGNLLSALDAALRNGSCSACVDDLKVVTATAVVYPDVLVVCRALAPDDDRVPDPTLVIEVLSPTTETHDRIRKWRSTRRFRRSSTAC